MLEISDLVKTYPNGLKALHGVSLSVERPMVVAIIGSSGAGKSTLIRCVNRLAGNSAVGSGCPGLRVGNNIEVLRFEHFN